jgi:hypothetical protein
VNVGALGHRSGLLLLGVCCHGDLGSRRIVWDGHCSGIARACTIDEKCSTRAPRRARGLDDRLYAAARAASAPP